MRKEKINLPIELRENKGIIIDKNANKLFVWYGLLHLWFLKLLNNNNKKIKNTAGTITKRSLKEKKKNM